MIVGITGTHVGMTPEQKDKVLNLLLEVSFVDDVNTFHMGDCVGADAQAADMAWGFGYNVIVHPTNDINRYHRWNVNLVLFREGQTAAEVSAKSYLKRNMDIVNASDLMLATPAGGEEELRSGTWHAIRYIRKKEKRLIIVWPNGDITKFHCHRRNVCRLCMAGYPEPEFMPDKKWWHRDVRGSALGLCEFWHNPLEQDNNA